MKRKVIIGLTAVTLMVGSYAVINQYGVIEEEEGAPQATNPEQPTEAVNQLQESVEKEVLYLNAEEIQSIQASRDPFQTPAAVSEQFERREQEYNKLKERIKARVDELTEQKAREEAEAQGEEYVPAEKPFDEILREEIEKIISESTINLQKTQLEESQSVSSGSSTNDQEIMEIAAEQASKNGIDSNLILAIIGSKTSADGNFEVRDENGTSNRGLMQINTTTAKWLAGLMGIAYEDGMEFDNEKNIMLGAYYLGYLKKQHQDPHYMITAYYIGPSGAERHKEKTGTYKSDYSNIIMGRIK